MFKAGLAVSKIRAEKYLVRHGKEAAMIPTIKRGDIFYADLSPVIGSEQGGLRPVLIVQNDVGNKYSPTVIAAAITSRMGKTRLPTHIDIHADRVGLAKDSVILLEQIRTLDKKRLKEKMGHLDDTVMKEVNEAITISFGLSQRTYLDTEGQSDIPSVINASSTANTTILT
jgi:mRNA interferase MazF